MSSKGPKLPLWVRVAAGLRRDKKIIMLFGRGQYRAIVIYVFGLGYCREELTDGCIPAWALTALLANDKDAKVLVDAGLWDPIPGGGWRVHNYLKWQEPADDIRARSAAMSDLAKHRRQGRSALHLAAGGDRP